MTEFEKKVLEFIEWRRGQLSRASWYERLLSVLLGAAICVAALTELIPLLRG